MVTPRAKVFVAAEKWIAENARRLLGEVSACHLVGQVESNHDLVAKITALEPAVVLIQHKLPNLNIVETTSEIKKANEPIKVLVLLSDEDEFWSALESNADGYVLWPTTLLHSAIDTVTHGGVWLGPLMSEYLLRGPGFSILRSAARTMSSMPPLFQLLSAREKEVLNLLLDGLTNQQIADSLDLSVGTVKVHVRHILGKLKLKHRNQAIVTLNKLWANTLSTGV